MKETVSSMKAQARWRGGAAAGVAVALLVAALVWERPAEAGGPLFVGGTVGSPGDAFVWDTATPVSYHTDQGTLGSLSTAEADALVRAAFDVWRDVPTANIGFTRTGDLGLDVTGANQMNFFNNFINDCDPPQAPAPTNAVNAIVYDSDGAITDDLFGEQQSEEIIGFAGLTCVSGSPSNRLTRGRAVLNGRFIDGDDLEVPDLAENKFREVFVHEFGHLIGLDHSQANNEALDPTLRSMDRLFGLPLMFPVLFGATPARVDAGFPALAPDDEAWVSSLYPETANNPPTQVPFANQFGRIEGNVFFSDGVTPLQGTNLVARLEDNVATAEDERLRFAYSATSGFLFTGNPGQTVTCTNPSSPTPETCTNFGDFGPGSSFGSRDPTLIGLFQIPLKAGKYTVEVEAIDPDWIGGSSVGPLGADAGEQFPLPGPREFWNAGESNADELTAFSFITVTAGNTTAGIDIILNGTPPRFDSFESARLEWREPAPAWLRERRPPAFLVAV